MTSPTTSCVLAKACLIFFLVSSFANVSAMLVKVNTSHKSITWKTTIFFLKCWKIRYFFRLFIFFYLKLENSMFTSTTDHERIVITNDILHPVITFDSFMLFNFCEICEYLTTRSWLLYEYITKFPCRIITRFLGFSNTSFINFWN